MKNESCLKKNPLICSSAPPGALHKHQQGIVLLAMILVVLVGSSAVLLGKLNANAQEFARTAQTQAALRDARNALIRYAVTYPETQNQPDRGPGYLPCPDQNEDGLAETTCSSTIGSTLGRLPSLDLGVDGSVDSSGERIWYAVSENFKGDQPATHVLNSETPATLRLCSTVDAGLCTETIDDVVAILIAAGPPVQGQDGRGDAVIDVTKDHDKSWYEVAAEYLEDDNPTSTDESYFTAPTGANSAPACTDGSLDAEEVALQCLNDQIVTITRRELMAAVEARVANEVRGVLAAYRDSADGAFPWLAPFADPKRGGRYAASLGGYGISGQHTGPDSSTVLTDMNADFLLAGVAAGDVVWNLADHSYGAITAVTATTVTVAGLSGGTSNDFAVRDEVPDPYYIAAAAPVIATPFIGTAAAGSGGTTLVAERNLEQWGVVPGDVIDKPGTGSAVVVSVANDVVTLDRGGLFGPADNYRVRTAAEVAMGVAEAGSAGLSLVNTAVNFADNGVQAGEVIQNLTDGSQGIILTVASNTLTVAALSGGESNDFDVGDTYTLNRNVPVSGTRFGLLPLHESGKRYGNEFSIKWSMTSANGNTVTVPAAGFTSDYTSGRQNWIESSSNHFDPDGASASYPDTMVAGTDVNCTWIAFEVVDCSGEYVDDEFLKATAESVTPASPTFGIEDLSTRFYDAGVTPGARIRNLTLHPLDDDYDGVVIDATAGNQNYIRVVPANPSTQFTVTPGNSIQVLIATKRSPEAPGTFHTNTSAVSNEVCATGADFWSFVGAGSTIRLTSPGFGEPVGIIYSAPTADCVVYYDLQGGTAATIAAGQEFEIYYDHVEKRTWKFTPQLAGTGAVTTASPGMRQRSICQGFDASCANESTNTLFGPPGPVISFTDYNHAATALGTASVEIPAAEISASAPCDPNRKPCGSVLVSGLDFTLSADTDSDTDPGLLPRWFLRNRWHEYVFVSYSNNLPAALAACTAGTNCLSVDVSFSAGASHNDREAMIVVASAGFATQDRAATHSAISDYLAEYFEGQNADPVTDPEHMVFIREDASNTFNDQISSVSPAD